MAKVIATVGGVALKPGVSLNRRLYTRPMIAAAVHDAQRAIETGDAAVVRDLDGLASLTHHAAGDDSTRIVGRLKSLTLDEDGSARYSMDLADTPHGRTIASLADTSDGQAPFLQGVSIRGAWTGTVRKIKGPDGKPVETADGLQLLGLDFTRSPGVPGAGVDTFAWADGPGQSETTERVLITESVEEARVTITEQAATAEGEKSCADMGHQCCRDAAAATESLIPVPHVLEDGICASCVQVAEGGDAPGGGSKPYGNVAYADPGYQADKKKRYPIDTKAHAKAAWAYVNQPDNAKLYKPGQLKRIKGRIKAALGKFGVSVASESAEWVLGWTYDAPVQESGEVAEYYGDSSRMGSWCVSASNGPVNLSLSSYCVDPEDLDVILRAAADAACKALAALDPDMDGDIDVPGVGDGSDTDGDGGKGEAAPASDDVTETSPAEHSTATTGTEDPAMAETTTPAEQAAPGTDQKTIAEAVAAALAQQEEARQARKAAKRAAKEQAATEAARAATESAAQQAAANAALGQGIPATAGATATETEDQRRARLARLVDEQFTAAAAKEGLAAEKTDEQLIAEMLEERLVPLRQARAEQGGVQRKGIAKLQELADGPDVGKKLQEATNEELAAMAGAAYGPKGAR